MNTATLEELERMLRESPMTARAIAEAMGCSKPVAYARLRALSQRVRLARRKVRERPSGPKAVAYAVRVTNEGGSSSAHAAGTLARSLRGTPSTNSAGSPRPEPT